MSRRVAATAVLILAATSAAVAAPRKPFEVRPGPAGITPEEASLVAADAGDHAVVLVWETIRTDHTSVESDVEHHFRAKILTDEGRDLANIEIPGIEGWTKLEQWWGRVFLPDGSVLELPKEEVRVQSLVRSREGNLVTFRAALPGVVPGAVVDYGWKLRTLPVDHARVELQGPYRVLSLRLGWRPREIPWLTRITRSEGRQVTHDQDANGVWITARDLPAVVEEPNMPPLAELRTAAHLCYVTATAARAGDYWSDVARTSESWVRAYNKPGVIKDAVRRIGVTEDEPLESRLRRAYAWLQSNVRRTDLRSVEELELAAEQDRESPDKAKEVLAAGEGTANDLDWLFLGIARELGAQARLVFVADRTRNYFDPGLRTLDQFAGTIVAVGAPASPIETWRLVDAGSGLPYGEVPWYFSGIAGFAATGPSATILKIPPSPAAANVTTTVGTVRFVDGNEAVSASWVRTATGQSGYDTRRALRALEARERTTALKALCGADDGLEVLSSESPGLEAPAGAFTLRCETESEPERSVAGDARYLRDAGGPWFEPMLDLPGGHRTHPLVFRFPRTEIAAITYEAPEGYVPGDPPPAVTIPSRFGEYSRTVERLDRSFEVRRRFVRSALAIPAADYDAVRAFLTDVRASDGVPLPFVPAGAGEP